MQNTASSATNNNPQLGMQVHLQLYEPKVLIVGALTTAEENEQRIYSNIYNLYKRGQELNTGYERWFRSIQQRLGQLKLYLLMEQPAHRQAQVAHREAIMGEDIGVCGPLTPLRQQIFN